MRSGCLAGRRVKTACAALACAVALMLTACGSEQPASSTEPRTLDRLDAELRERTDGEIRPYRGERTLCPVLARALELTELNAELIAGTLDLANSPFAGDPYAVGGQVEMTLDLMLYYQHTNAATYAALQSELCAR